LAQQQLQHISGMATDIVRRSKSRVFNCVPTDQQALAGTKFQSWSYS